ncbi:Lrp/AsnC family transcriptional regulator [Devriesea agamarum]|uniref:Lrp/AsnC family transcriptional regulator n=1 Tax=Devriesea agamarum TaxID=472569 RepID=UPI00071DAF05|nr:Lrp/AsnC family transcriptional regulator [Devriesea agamarum]
MSISSLKASHVVDDSLSEIDIRLLSVLQHAPRAPFSLVGEVLGISDRTAARHWQGLLARGAAFSRAKWHGIDNNLVTSLIALDSAGRDDDRLLSDLVELPGVVTVERTLRGADALLTTSTRGIRTLGRDLLPAIRRIPGVRRTRTTLVTRRLASGLEWRMRELSTSQLELLKAANPPAKARRALRPDDLPILRELITNPRICLKDVAHMTHTGIGTVRGALDSALASGTLQLGVEIDPFLLGYDIECVFQFRMNLADIWTLRSILRTLGVLRFMVTTAGPENVTFGLLVRSADDIAMVNETIQSRIKHARLVDTILAFRWDKLGGWLLEPDSFAAQRFVQPPL